jgi:hypothetical protein
VRTRIGTCSCASTSVEPLILADEELQHPALELMFLSARVYRAGLA